MNNAAVIAKAVVKALEVTQTKGLYVGQKVGHSSIPDVCVVVRLLSKWAVIQPPRGSAFLCGVRELFDIALVERFALRMAEERSGKTASISLL